MLDFSENGVKMWGNTHDQAARISYRGLRSGAAGQIATTASADENSISGTYAELSGVRLWFTDSGGTGVPIVLLHANTGTSAIWTDQVASFSRAGYRVIAFDRRGWGKSMANPATGPQPGSVAGDLDALANYLKLDKFHLLGVAGGGFAALDYAAWHPERLRSLVIGGSTGSVSDKEIAEFSARIEIPGLRQLPAAYREVGRLLSRRQPGRHQALDRD